MHLIINGEPRDLPLEATPSAAPAPVTIESLLTHLNLTALPCAVELNKKLIRKSAHAATPLAPNDRLEIVSLVGGG
ncbi:hypothetical protein BH11PLA1_BH11PLA1_23160 [soil metagenome]